MGKKQIQKTLNIFTKRVKTAFHPEQVLLFGSYGYGKASDYSDVDIVVVARKFRSIKPEKRLDALYPLTKDLRPDFHVFGVTPEEWKNASPLTTLAEAKNRGIRLI